MYSAYRIASPLSVQIRRICWRQACVTQTRMIVQLNCCTARPCFKWLCQLWRLRIVFFFSVTLWPNPGRDLLIFEVSGSHSLDTPQSVRLPWTSEQPVAETSTWQHTTLTTNIHAPSGIRTHIFCRQAVGDLRLGPRGQGGPASV